MSTVAIVFIVGGVVLLVFFLGGLLAARRRARLTEHAYARHVAEADHALEQARAADRGWDREGMEQAARKVLAERQPEFNYEDLHLVLVEDRPGVSEDRAQFVAVGPNGDVRVVLTRRGDHWVAEPVA